MEVGMKTEFDFDALRESGVTQAEFAALFGVSRTTVNTWVAGRLPTKFLQSRVYKYLRLLRQGVDNGSLPGALVNYPSTKENAGVRGEIIDAALKKAASELTD